MAEWLPIETAPKDGTPILAYANTAAYPERFPTFYAVIAWREVFDDYDHCWVIFDGNYRNLSSGPSFTWRTPTHWQPLPTPPLEIEDV